MTTIPFALRHRAVILTATLLACSGSPSVDRAPSGPAAQDIAVTISPDSATLGPLAQLAFTATVTGTIDQSVTWAIEEGATGGTVDGAGSYTAPPTPGSYHLVVTSKADTTKSATATITVTATPPPPSVAVTVAPKTASVVAAGSQAFTCTVTGSSDTACTWTVQERTSGGSITSSGLYTAPQSAGTYHVVATSHADPTKTDVATVTVTAPPANVAITLTPTTTAIDACATYTFRASVTGSTDTGVTWSVAEGSTGGSVNASGVYTAPSTGGTYHVVATSNADPSKTRTATVTVSERIVSVSVSPTTANVTTGGTVQFTATVTTTCGAFTQTAQALVAGQTAPTN